MQNDRCGPRPTRPRSWWSCASPKRSASSTSITLAVGHVDSDLDHRRRDQHVEVPRREAGHRRVAHIRPLLPVDHPDPKLWEGCPQPVRLGVDARDLERLGLEHQRHDHERLPSLGGLRGDERLDLRQRGPSAHLCPDRLAPGRKLSDGRDRQVAVHRERERAGNRRRRQGQQVRLAAGALGLEGSALTDPESMLLVHHDQAEALELDGGADDGVGADDDLGLPGGDGIVDVPLLARAERARQELGSHAEGSEERREAGVVLPSQQLGGCHEGCLPARLHGGGQRDGRHRGLAAPDVSLEEAAHRSLRGDVAQDILDGRGLVAGQRERQASDDQLSLLSRRVDLRCAQRRAGGTRLGQGQLEREELVEGEAIQGAGDIGRILGKVGGAQRIGEGCELAALGIGQGVLDCRQRRLEEAGEELSEPLLRDPRAEVVHGHHAGGVDRVAADRAELGRGELRTPTPNGYLARHDQLVPHRQAALDVAAAEPDGLGAAAVVVGELGDHALRLPAEARLDPDGLDAHPRRLLLVGQQLAQGTELAEVVVTEREVPQRLARRGDSQSRQGRNPT